MPPFIDLTGKRYGRLVCLKDSGRDKNRKVLWLCKCDCGNKTVVPVGNLISGNTKSCGCLKIDQLIARSTKHGLSRVDGKAPRLYQVWKHMRQRCRNPNFKDYKNYGARDIKICPAWNADYENFHNWALANGYRSDLTIERIDNNLGYSPQNCRWATRKEQSRNARSNRHIWFNGKDKIAAEWAETLGIKYSTLNMRLRRGWSIERALTEPVNQKLRVRIKK